MTSNNNNSHKGVFGTHHVTAITSNPQKNVDFYTEDLGLRLVKLFNVLALTYLFSGKLVDMS